MIPDMKKSFSDMMKERRVGMILLAAGLAACLFGYFCTEEVDIVLQKAINICLECIGIG